MRTAAAAAAEELLDYRRARRYNYGVQSLDNVTNIIDHADGAAELVMETVTLVTRAIRRDMRAHRPAGLSMQQFRALGIVQRHPGASLSLVAERLGLTGPSASRLIEFLARAGFVSRIDCPRDRRRVELRLTCSGELALEAARAAALGRLGRMLAKLSEGDHRALERAMRTLRGMFDGEERNRV